MTDDLDPPRVWVREFDHATVRKLAEGIETAEATLPIYILSNGGDVHHLFAMLDLVAAAKSYLTVVTVALGTAQSAALDLLAAGTKGHRWCAPNATLMVHDNYDGWGSRKNSEVQVLAKQAQAERDRAFNLLAANTGKTLRFWNRYFAKRQNTDAFLTAEEGRELGFVDHIGVPRLTVETTRKVKAA